MASGGVSAQEQLDLDRIFRCKADDAAGRAECREARELIMGHCNSCHMFSKVVWYQASEQKWSQVMVRMRDRASELTDAQVDTILRYVIANFGEDQPPPELPESLIIAAQGGR